MYNLIIIGGGPAGYVAAEKAGANGLKVALFEKKNLGGVCLNEGCIPTKTLLYSAKIYDNALHANQYGVLTENVGHDFSKIMARKNKVVRKLISGIKSKMKFNNVTLIEGEVTIIDRSNEGVVVECNKNKYVAENLLICTGSEAMIPPISGINEIGDILLTNREILQLKSQPENLVVIGGGVVGIEFASFFNSLGTQVTVIEMLPEILTGMDAEISAMLRDQLTKKGITFHLNAKVIQIDKNKVFFEKDGITENIKGDKILLSVGRKPNVDGLGLEDLNIELYKGGIKVDEKMQTNVPNVYAAGDVTGFSLLAHTASREGEVVVNNLIGRKDIMRYHAVPHVVYTNPEVAGVGETEATAKAKGLQYKLLTLPMAYSGRFVAENERVNGICKIIVGEKHHEVLGVHMIGNPASEIIYGVCIAIEQEMTVEQLQEVIFPHPTVSEIIKEVLNV